ncbi:hypothetical protein FBU30_001692 [Linnemannia zychae]|nr:hypothetical protein FBU30_001692 [Linnemannia zychae]
MEFLITLFPQHSRTQLQDYLDRAGGVVEVAIEALFDVPAVPSTRPTPSLPHSIPPVQFPPYPPFSPQLVIPPLFNPPIHTYPNGVISQSHSQGKAAKRQKQIPGPASNSVVDLTWSDEEDSKRKKNNSQESKKLSQSLIEIDDDKLELEEFQRPSAPASSSGRSAIPSFEDFHKQEQERIEDARLKEQQAEEQRMALVNNFVAHAQVMFDNISVPYLERLIAENRPRIASDGELIDTCIETIFKTNGKYPRAKRKRDDGDDGGSESDEDEALVTGNGYQGSSTSRSSARAKRDFNDCTINLGADYMSNSATQLYQDFPSIAAVSIRSVLDMFSYHYIPAFEYLKSLLPEGQDSGKGKKRSNGGDVRLVMNKVPRKIKPPRPLDQLDADFRKELLWLRAKIEKEQAEIKEAQAEEENLRIHTENNNLRECGCCFDDVPANRIAQCDAGHIFCLSCSRRGAEVELGYRRTVLKCMTGECTQVFPDSEAAGLDSLVECPFCSYAAIIENDEDKEFRCQGPKCRKVSCRLCKALTHIPLSCEEYKKELEKDNVLSVQHKVEEEMSQALIRECPKCKARFFKTEGCNKMTCPECHTKMCYVCKIKIKDYSHFDNTPAGQPAAKPNKCRLWEDTIQRNNNEVKAAAQKTLQELKTQDPNLAAQVRLDIPK